MHFLIYVDTGGKELDLSIVIPPKEIFLPIRRNLHFKSVAKLLRLSIFAYNCVTCDLAHCTVIHSLMTLSIVPVPLNRKQSYDCIIINFLPDCACKICEMFSNVVLLS